MRCPAAGSGGRGVYFSPLADIDGLEPRQEQLAADYAAERIRATSTD
jgi:hypothetical protein